MFRKQKLQRVKKLFIFAFFLSVTAVVLLPLSNKVQLGAVPFVEPPPPTPRPGSPIPGTIDSSAIPSPVVPCLEEDLPGQPASVLRNPEYHSLRPYQASPCGELPKAYYCNNDYQIIEEVKRRWDNNWCWQGSVNGGPGEDFFCEMEPNATATGPDGRTHGVYIIGEQDGRDYAISLNKVEYPILGNTDDVFNSQSSSETFDATGKMNEYVNWYLQGVIEKAEYGLKYPSKQGEKPVSQFVTFAGPTKKLLPFDILNLRRLQVLHDAGVKPWQDVSIGEYQGNPDLLEYDPVTGKWRTRQTLNHNHIAVCAIGGGFFGSIPIPCYSGNGGRASNFRRLVAWWDSRGSTPSQLFYDWTINDVWGGTTPPFPWHFDDPYLYRKALLEWSGKTCIPIPLTNTYGCFGYSPRTLATLYEFVPLGNSNDQNAGHYFIDLQVRAHGDTQYQLLGYQLENSPVLHYPHAESTVQVSKLLNEINTPLECTENEDATEEDLPGEGLACCPNGFYFVQGSCVSNVLDSACGTFASGMCAAVELIPGDFGCNSVNDISDVCQQQIVSAATPNVDGDLFCSAVFSVIGGGIADQIGILAACKALVGTLISSIADAVVQSPSCESGLSCEMGTCVNPDRVAPLSCSKIGGSGKNYEPTTCEFTEVRINKGDDISFRNPMSFLYVKDVKTRVDIIQCDNTGRLSTFMADVSDGGCGGITWNRCQTDKCTTKCTGPVGTSLCPCGGSCPVNPLPGICTSWPECRTELTITIPTAPKIPGIDQIWINTVIANNSSFRRIFPKLEEGAPVECIKEIPAYSPVTYITNWETNLTSISTAGPNTYPGGGPLSQSQGKLFFPHLGTIYEYFLKGIQTALRPKGFGQTYIVDGKRYSVPQGDLEKCITNETAGACKMWLFERDKSGQFYYEKIIQAAENTTCNGQTMNPAWALFIALNEDAGLMTDNIDGWGDDHFGCFQNETLDANDAIEVKTSCMLNTLRNDCSAGKTDLEALCEYGYQSACGGSYADFGNMFLLGLAADPPPPIWGGSSSVPAMIASLTTNNYSSFSQFVEDFCPNSTELALPPY